MEHLISLVDSLAWPATVLALFYMLREPLRSLLPFVESIKYKDGEVKFRKGLKEARAEAIESKIELKPSPEEKEEINQLLNISPSSAIVESWKEIEIAARDKIQELVKDKKIIFKSQRNPLSHLQMTGALIPSTARAIRDLESLRNQAAHTRDLQISKESTLEYVTLARAITKQIIGITELPKQKLTVLTLLILEYTHIIDTGKYNHIRIEDIHTQIENKNIIEFLRNETAGDSDFSLFTEEGPYSEYLTYYSEQMYQLYGGYAGNERHKWGIENSGICLLVAWTNELIQQGSGWHPYE